MEDKNLETTEEKTVPVEEQSAKSLWQQTKESWYDKISLSLKQLDLIVWLCWAALAIAVVLAALDAMDIFHLFG